MRPRIIGLIAANAAVVVAAGLAVTLFATHGQAARSGPGALSARSGPAGMAAAPPASGFGWLRPHPAPAGWVRARLPHQAAALSYPAWLHHQPGDAGTVTVGLNSRTGTVLAYLNVTPQQGDESLRDWSGFRLAHLREDGDRAVRLDARSSAVAFPGGRGSCVMDDYTTRMHGNHYREIACFVRAAGHGSVLVAATAATEWQQYGGVLERAVSAYRAG